MRYAIDENAIETSAPWNELKSVPPDTRIIARFSPSFNVNLSPSGLAPTSFGLEGELPIGSGRKPRKASKLRQTLFPV